jgi:transcriptional/translational regulatory protein YebC/TACO1
LTDNVNRTVSEVRNAFTKVGSKMGVSGSVEHGYKHLCYVTISGMDEETTLETLLMADIEILELEEVDGNIEIEALGYDVDKIQEALKEADESVEIIDSESGWYPLDYIELEEENQILFDKFMTLINDVEDVQEVYHNVKED